MCHNFKVDINTDETFVCPACSKECHRGSMHTCHGDIHGNRREILEQLWLEWKKKNEDGEAGK